MNDAVKTDLAEYYARRAAEYETIYARPERQADLAALRERVRELLQGQRVLEIACGTGYWTAQIADVADAVLATDISPEVIEVARAKNLPADKVRFAPADAFGAAPSGEFTACLAGFWWSHVRREEQGAFLQTLRAAVGKDGLLVMMDNTYVEGSSTPVARTDAHGNTYQMRRLANGDRYEILKNFPSDSALRKTAAASLRDIRILRLEHFWLLSGKFK
jgi:SAM-dependent methyltransferase